MTDSQELLDRGLPKWPQFLLSGCAISKECALEIIRRTDTYFDYPEHAGNNHEFAKRAIELFRYPQREEGAKPETFTDHYKRCEAWRAAWGLVHTSYVHNSWIACSFIGGPHGWCHPTGRLHFVHNLGKYPSVGDVLEDLRTIAEHFPILHMDAVLMDKESSEDGPKTPVVGFLVRGKEVELVDGNDDRLWQTVPDPHQSGETGSVEQMLPGLLLRMQMGRGDPNGGSGENYFSIQQLKDMWSKHIPEVSP